MIRRCGEPWSSTHSPGSASWLEHNPSRWTTLFIWVWHNFFCLFCWCLCLTRHGKLIWCQQLNRAYFDLSLIPGHNPACGWLWPGQQRVLFWQVHSCCKRLKRIEMYVIFLGCLELDFANVLNNKRENESKEVWWQTAVHLFPSPINSSWKSTFMSFETHVWWQTAQGPCRLQPCAWLLQNRKATHQEGGSISVIMAGKRFIRNGDDYGSKGTL